MGSGYDLGDPEDHFGNPEMVSRQPGAKLYDFISEGDSPSYFVLFDFFGLRSGRQRCEPLLVAIPRSRHLRR